MYHNELHLGRSNVCTCANMRSTLFTKVWWPKIHLNIYQEKGLWLLIFTCLPQIQKELSSQASSLDQGTRQQQRRALCPHVAFNWIQLCLNILQLYQHGQILIYSNLFQLYQNLHYSILHSYLKLHKHIPVVSKFHLKWIRDDPWPDFNSCLALSPLRYLLWMFSKTSLL